MWIAKNGAIIEDKQMESFKILEKAYKECKEDDSVFINGLVHLGSPVETAIDILAQVKRLSEFL